MANNQEKQGDALDAVIQEQETGKSQETPKAAEAPKVPEKPEGSKTPSKEDGYKAAEKPAKPDPDVMLIHPHLGTQVPVKESLVAQALKQGFKRPEKAAE